MPDLRPSDRRGDANVATLLTWFLPGAGHLYLGRGMAAALFFVVVEGLYVLGWVLSDGRSFEFLDPELRGTFATVLSPEAGNLGGLIAQMRVKGFGTGEASPFPAGIHLGSMLCAASGMLNVCAMAHANLDARTPSSCARAGVQPALAVLGAWLVPGLGHLMQGRRLRAAIVFVLLVGLLLWGTLLADASNLSRERHFYYWSGQYLAGLPAILGEVVSGRPPVTGELRLVDVGLLFGCMAGLLNILAMLDVFGYGERRWLAEVPKQPAAATPPAADAAPMASAPTEPASTEPESIEPGATEPGTPEEPSP